MSRRLSIFCRKCSPALLFLLVCLPAFSQYNFAELDKSIAAQKKELGKNVVVMICKGGKVIYKKESDDLKAGSQEPFGDCSSWLTAALVMTFVDQGKISLDDKVGKYLPVFNDYGKKFITIRHCLTHMTGIHSDQGVMKWLEKSHFASLDDEVKSYANKKEIENNPGVDFFYSQVGANIVGRILEVVGKKSFDQLMNERILRPINMHNTSFFNEHGASPASGAVSAAQDYLNFMAMLLNKGMFNNKRVLSENAVAEMEKAQITEAQIKYAPELDKGYLFGLGEWIESTDASGNAQVVSYPGALGAWPVFDRCGDYACVIFAKGELTDKRKKIYSDIKRVIDEIIPSHCK